MPRNFEMTWNAKSQRWFKKSGGKQIAVGCGQLAKSYPKLFTEPTKEGSYRAANQYWLDRQESPAEIRSKQIIAACDEYLEEANGFIERWSGKAPAADGPTIGDSVAKFLAGKEADIGRNLTVGRFDMVKRSAEHFRDWIKSETPVAAINAAKLAEYRTHLIAKLGRKELGDHYANGHLQVAKQFIAWAYELELLPSLPRNFNSKNLIIKIQTKAIERYSIEEAKQLLADAVDRTRLYLLLTLNCGMTQTDISDLSHADLAWKEGYITRKRSKTKQHENVPTVSYKLWPSTKALLARFATNPDESSLVLVNRNGLPLVRVWLSADKKLKKVDTVRLAYKHVKTSVPDKGQRALRKTSASLLADNPQFATVKTLFLGHSPRSIADKHYADAPQNLLDAAVDWLGQQLGQMT